jgi:hypothetical protein
MTAVLASAAADVDSTDRMDTGSATFVEYPIIPEAVRSYQQQRAYRQGMG